MSDTPRGNIEARIAEYLSTGGLFNPEFADHNAVRDLIIDCRKELIDVRSDAKSWADQCSERVKDWDEMRTRAEAAESELADLRIKMAEAKNDAFD